jgi:hypothetical protein
MFAHGGDTVLNAPMFLSPFEVVTSIIVELFDPKLVGYNLAIDALIASRIS